MSVLVICPGKDPEQWKIQLKKQLPELNTYVYPEDHNYEEVEYAITWKHPRGIFKNYPNLKVIASMGAGVDHITSDPDIPKQAIITRIVDEQLTEDMSAFVLALVMDHLRNVSMHHSQHEWKPENYKRIKDLKIGVMGLGVLGSAVAETLAKNGFDVLGWSRTPNSERKIKSYYGSEQLESFLNASSILICLLPLTRETENILNKRLFSRLPKGAYIINVARGQHLVEHDLLEMIDTGHLEGASLDVFRQEPLPQEHAFWRHPKIKITPHVASVTNPESAVNQIIGNYKRMKTGKPLKNIVQKEKGY